jgi:hypothetical protein
MRYRYSRDVRGGRLSGFLEPNPSPPAVLEDELDPSGLKRGPDGFYSPRALVHGSKY